MDKFLSGIAKGAGTFLLIVLFSAGMAVAGAYPVMLGLGALHNDVSTAVPALGFWTTWAVLWGSATAIGYLRPTPRKA